MANGEFVGPPVPWGEFGRKGEQGMDPITIAAILGLGQAAVGYFGGGRDIEQHERDRALSDEQWRKMFDRASEWREEDILRQEEARLEAIRQWEAEQAQSEAEWRTDIERALPNIAASRAILGSTMQMDVPAFRPRYSEEEGVEREPNPYGPYKYSPRSA
jgi:hypothetical protein|tara:strand:+ start:2674 stop:3153 length:480 start_codon:yes stop_codon:yes gene_type:complete